MSDQAGEISGSDWNPAQYSKFGDHRLRPALELLHRATVDKPSLIYDLGCGTGEVAQIMADRWPAARITGVDISPEMLKKAKSRETDIRWQQADIATWSPVDAPDLLYSNAALHWLPDHSELFPRLLGSVRPAGCLAVQMPLSWDLPSHRLMRETLVDCGLRGVPLGGDMLKISLDRKWVEDANYYFDLLNKPGATIDIWETEYQQILEGDNAVYQWVQATGLRPILNGLNAAEQEIFIPEYQARLNQIYPTKPDGSVLYPFRRLFLVIQLS